MHTSPRLATRTFDGNAAAPTTAAAAGAMDAGVGEALDLRKVDVGVDCREGCREKIDGAMGFG